MHEEVIEFIHKTLPFPKIEESKNVLCILPHPDDGEIGAGGTIAKLKANGATVRYILVTDGGAGIRGKSREETKKIRKSEQEEAAMVLGVDEIHWLGYPDGGGYDIEDVKKDLEEKINEIKPDLVMTVDPFLPYEGHPDHKNCGLAVVQTLLFKTDKNIPIAFFFTAYPNQFVCVDDYWEKKFQAILAHKSQIQPSIVDLYREYFEVKCQAYAKKKGCQYAEGFKVLFPLMLHAFEETLWV